MQKTIHIGCDHAAVDLKTALIKHLEEKGFGVKNHGTNSSDSVDYPDFAHAVSSAVEKDPDSMGILICGSGNGINMAANKHKGIRSALCWMPEIATLARQHNNANIIALPGRFVTIDEGKNIVDAFLEASFEGGRHQQRIDKIAAC